MKKNSIYALMSAIALSGGVMFSGCSSSDDVVTNEYGEEINPTYDPVAKTVKTDFTIALTGQVNDSKAETRMEGADVQATGFLGIKDIVLLPYSGTPADDNSAGSAIALGDNTISDRQLNAQAGSHHYHYIGVEVPTGTKNFLFYGVSNPANATTVADRFKYGVLNPTLAGKVKPSEIKFDLVPIYPTVEATNAKRDALVNYLKEIAAATDGVTAWKDVSAATDAELNALYISFTSLKSGSSASIRKHVQNTFSLVYNRTSDVNIGTVAQAIVDAICGEENKYATEGLSDPEDPTSKNGILTFNDTNVPTDYPKSINLPDGAAVIQWTDGVPSVLSNEEDIIKANNNPMTNYVYPPSLYYYTNSTIRVANTVQDNNYAIKGADEWNEILSGYGSENGTVTEVTRDIALEKEIQYAVGRMELTVKPGATTLKDRNGTPIAIADGSFEVTGIFIGSQHSKNYNFADNNGATEYLVYDKLASAIPVPASSASTANHTLAMQTTADASVAIAVELVNKTGVDFVGYDGIIPNGSKFYLSTSLEPNTGTNYSSTVNSVFIQDYVTKVNLTISANSDGSGEPAVYPKGLGDARVTIPNLGTPALRLGFSVDLSWSNGLVFSPEI